MSLAYWMTSIVVSMSWTMLATRPATVIASAIGHENREVLLKCQSFHQPPPTYEYGGKNVVLSAHFPRRELAKTHSNCQFLLYK